MRRLHQAERNGREDWRRPMWVIALAFVVIGAGAISPAPVRGQDDQLNMPPVSEVDEPQTPRRGRGQTATRGRQAAEFRNTFQSLAKPHADSVVRIDVERRQVALGTVVSENGRIVSKSSQLPDQVQIRLADGRTSAATVIARSEELDLALLQTELSGLTPVNLELGGAISAGDFVATLGPERDVRFVGIAATSPREFRFGRGGGNRGRTGGGFLGVQTVPVETGVGLAITQIVPDSAALRAGLRPGDRLTHIAGTPVESTEQLVSLLSSRNPGEEVELRVQREDEEVSLIAKLGAQQTSAAQYDRWGGGPFSERRFGFPAVIPHDTPLPPTDCGGPIVNTRGEIVGINISRALRVSTYALPLADVRAFVQAHP
ncbi:MAG TPA: PDZ domain-containing protein [Pirellulaceae bacterium]|nr:PDZ domain-containing protein [Pirellulaceae bacterium]